MKNSEKTKIKSYLLKLPEETLQSIKMQAVIESTYMNKIIEKAVHEYIGRKKQA